jgi:hypothetical protein
MAEGVPFKESNGTMGCGQNDPDRVYDLPVYFGTYDDGSRDIISCWQLTTEEIAEIARTGKVWLRVLGTGMPPIAIQASSPFQST